MITNLITTTTDYLENSQLSNIGDNIFKSNKSLLLNNINIIARASDGYINLNQICKAAGKEFKEWKKNKNQ